MGLGQLVKKNFFSKPSKDVVAKKEAPGTCTTDIGRLPISLYEDMIPIRPRRSTKTSRIQRSIEESNDKKQISEEVYGSSSDSGASLPELSEGNSASPIRSRRSSFVSITSISSEESSDSILSSEDNNPSKEETENQVQPEQTAKTEPEMQKSGNSDGHIKDLTQLKEKNATVQKFSVNGKESKDTPPQNQSNNENLHVALAVGCALLAIGCFVAGAITFGWVGAGLFAIAVVSIIAAAITYYFTPPLSELTSTDLSPFVDGKQR